jgi:hypothetical protein
MSDFQKYLEQQMKDPKFAAEWEALEPRVPDYACYC